MFGNNSTIFRGPIIENVLKPAAEVSAEVGKAAVETGNKGPKTEGHHLVPRQLKGDPVVESARDGGFKFEGAENKAPVEKFSRSTGKGQHGNHPDYTAEVGKRLAEFKKENPSWTPEQATEFIRNTIKDLKETIQNNPDTKINDLFKSVLPAPAKDGVIQGLPQPGTRGNGAPQKKVEPPCEWCT